MYIIKVKDKRLFVGYKTIYKECLTRKLLSAKKFLSQELAKQTLELNSKWIVHPYNKDEFEIVEIN